MPRRRFAAFDGIIIALIAAHVGVARRMH